MHSSCLFDEHHRVSHPEEHLKATQCTSAAPTRVPSIPHPPRRADGVTVVELDHCGLGNVHSAETVLQTGEELTLQRMGKKNHHITVLKCDDGARFF